MSRAQQSDPAAAANASVEENEHGFNVAEQELLDRLYAQAEWHIVGHQKNLEALKVVVPHVAHDRGVSTEAFIRMEEDDLTLRIFNIKLSLLLSKKQQIENFLKNQSEKQAGKMLTLEELEAWVEVLRQRHIESTMHGFMAAYFHQKKRYCPESLGAETVIKVPCENFDSLEITKLSPALQANIRHFREQLAKKLELSEHESAEFPLLPEGYLLNEYLPKEEVVGYLDSRITSHKAKHARVHVETPKLKVELHAEEYAAQIRAHLVKLKTTAEKAKAELKRLEEDPLLQREASYAQQQIRDQIDIQSAAICFAEALQTLCQNLTNELNLIPLTETKNARQILSDSLTVTELLTRMRLPEELLLQEAEKDFKNYLKTFAATIYVFDPAQGRNVSQSLSDPDFEEAYCAKYRSRVKENLASLIAEWKDWDITGNPRDFNGSKIVSPTVRAQVELKLKLFEKQIIEMKAEMTKMEAKVERNKHLKERIIEKDASYNPHKQERFKIMVGKENWERYQVMLNHRKSQWALYQALPAGSTISWKDFYSERSEGVERLLEDAKGEKKGLAEMLVTFFPQVRLEKASLLIEEGIPSYSYCSENKNNLIHIALSNAPMNYDAYLVDIVQYLLARGVDAWQPNAKELSSGAMIKALISALEDNARHQIFQEIEKVNFKQFNVTDLSLIMRLKAYLARLNEAKGIAEKIDKLCMEASVLTSSREDFKELRLEVNCFLAKARALIAIESERLQKYKSDAYRSITYLFSPRPTEDLNFYEYALGIGHLSPFSILKDLLNLAPRSTRSTEFLKQFQDLLRELGESEAVKKVQTYIQERSIVYITAISPQLPIARVAIDIEALNMIRRLEELQAELDLTREQRDEAVARAVIAETRADSAETRAARAQVEKAAETKRADRAEIDLNVFKKNTINTLKTVGIWNNSSLNELAELNETSESIARSRSFFRK